MMRLLRCKADLKDLAKEKYWEWWYCKDGKEAKRLYAEYIELLEKANQSECKIN